jgi:HlyD family secretion protein
VSGGIHPGRRRRFAVGSGLALALAAGGIWYTLPRAPHPKTTLHWVAPLLRIVSSDVTATGTVKLKTGADVRVGAQISGTVERLNVSVGSRVNAGEVIAVIDTRAIRAAIAEARALLARDQAVLAKEAGDDARIKRLLRSHDVSQQQADDARADLAAQRATVVYDKSNLLAVKLNLSYATIRAPVSGIVGSVSTQQGETVAAAFTTPTFVTIIQPRALEMVATVDEADIGPVRIGQSVTFTTETYADRQFHGRVTRIAPTATIISGVVNYDVACSIEGNVDLLRPEMTATAVIHTAENRGLFIPAAAILPNAEGDTVIARTRSGIVQRRQVALGPRLGPEVEIRSGLGPKDIVEVEEPSS